MQNPASSHARQSLSVRPRVLRESNEQRVSNTMLESWGKQMLSRGLREKSIELSQAQVRRFAEFTGTHPWHWTPVDVEDFSTHLLSTPRSFSRSTVRSYQTAIRGFCTYVSSPLNGWPEIVEQTWGTIPTQICFEWNTVRHLASFEGLPERRGLTYDEIETLLDFADSRAVSLREDGRKGAIAAWRDAEILKLCYAFGLRRNEVAMLSVDDFFHNPDCPQYGRFGAVHVRYGKASKGTPPKRRTVLTVPEFDWVVESLDRWLSVGRPQISTAGRSRSLWPTERGLALAPRYISQRFCKIRDEAALDRDLTLHSLRHSYVSHLIEFGYAERFVQDQVGHSYASTTAIYANVTDDFRRRSLQKAVDGLMP